MVAALFVRRDSVYKSMPGVDAWDEDRDALRWPGGVPGVFHPPCRCWGQLAAVAKPADREAEKALGVWSIEQAREWGGVVEHPYASGLFASTGCGSFGIRDRWGGVLVPVLQSWWGHRAPKKTLLYVVGPIPDLSGFAAGGPALRTVESMCRREREATPFQFARLLVEVARASGRAQAQRARPDELATSTGGIH